MKYIVYLKVSQFLSGNKAASYMQEKQGTKETWGKGKGSCFNWGQKLWSRQSIAFQRTYVAISR